MNAFRSPRYIKRAALGVLAVVALAAAPLVAAVPEVIHVNAAAAGAPFPHFWEEMFGSGRAVLALNESYRVDLRAVKKATDFKYVRFHDILDDDVGVYTADRHGVISYNFSYVDEIYDGLLDAGVRPMVELSFMPSVLAASSKPHNFWYRPLPNPPKDYAQWAAVVKTFTAHLVERYGLAEVSQWYFEVWNEPNIDFWTGDPKQETYFRLYDYAAHAVKDVSPQLRVGGPATAQAAWVADFIRHCVDNHTPVDFVTTHVYGSDKSEKVFGTTEAIPRSDMVARSVRKVFDEVKASSLPNLPIIWSEYNATARNEVAITDAPFMGPWLANTIRQCDGLTTMMSYWDFSDVFDEQGVVRKPFYGGYGLFAARHIPKAAFNAFAMLHHLGTRRLPIDSTSALVTKNTDGSLVLAIWNYADPDVSGETREYIVELKGWSGRATASVQVLDDDHGSPLKAWQAMGSPAHPTREQIARLTAVAQLPAVVPQPMKDRLTLTLSPRSLALVEISKPARR